MEGIAKQIEGTFQNEESLEKSRPHNHSRVISTSDLSLRKWAFEQTKETKETNQRIDDANEILAWLFG